MTLSRTVAALVRTAAALGLVVAAGAATTSPASAAPQPMGRCTTGSGVVLAVDFSHWGGPVYRSCGTTPTTGYELLNQGGWRTTGTGHDGPAFICRIGYSGHQGGKQYPTPAQEDCVLTPPASAYWSYWHADPGANDWEYSRLGAMLYKPKPGSVDLWIFGGTDIGGTQGRPALTPDQLRAHNSTPTGGGSPAPKDTRTAAPPPGTDTGPAPDRPAPTTPRTAPPVPTTAPPPASPTPTPATPTPTTPTPTPPPSATSSAPVPTAPTAPTVTATDSGAPRVVDAAPAADAPHDAGSFTPVVATGGLVLLIGGGAWYAAKRRRTE
ncbi:MULTISPECIES: hypothetical protein [unclassified Streptomyces]|uniref:hypothetical protein n=1 Tax=unclassified Streptomyces TaxID=2593676 RepID=UPI001660ABCD|nr:MULTISPECIES: hypothetical protein [unclassified Streptomyces]MBD0710896.1 hypothetical protein [Streptomyces sp. CBMA291]MBD0713369.1 hypothetical protein [Streptomyces sp. CBMA370]